jgi:cob(I)alamin adenosyltransferase
MSDDSTFKDPELAINRVYTRKGDSGQTRLVGGQKVSKTDVRIEAYGTVDELNANVGAALVAAEKENPQMLDDLIETLTRVQHELFNLGSILATLPEDIGPQMPRVGEKDVEALETSIDRYNEDLPPLRSFVLPGGSTCSVELHRCRTVCRRAERRVLALAESSELDEWPVAYLNRLSDAFFVWSRYALVATERDEVLWQPNLGASGAKQTADD